MVGLAPTRGQVQRPRYTTTFIPAQRSLFTDDLSTYSGYDPEKWQRTRRAPQGNGACVGCMYGGDGSLRPIINGWKPDTKYETFETDLKLSPHLRSKLIISFPDERGYEHSISIDTYWIHQVWQGSLSKGIDIITPVHKNKRTDIFDLTQRHCLAISISRQYINIFIDGRQVWGIGHDSLSANNGAYVFDGYFPSTFSMGGELAELGYIRFAQSDEVPPDQIIDIRTFDTLLTGRSFVTHDILFMTGKADIRGESIEYLSSLAQWLRQNPTIKLQISGHTDNVGEDAANLALSQNRARAVVNYLAATGIEKSRLTSTGYGKTRPIATNDTEGGRAANRRVELRKL